MVEGRRYPRACVMARLALLRKARLHVIRIRSGVVVVCMAAIAVNGCALELVVDVASSAVKRRMRPCQCESGGL